MLMLNCLLLLLLLLEVLLLCWLVSAGAVPCAYQSHARQQHLVQHLQGLLQSQLPALLQSLQPPAAHPLRQSVQHRRPHQEMLLMLAETVGPHYCL